MWQAHQRPYSNSARQVPAASGVERIFVEALRKHHMANHEQWQEHTRHLPPMSVGDHVRLQNQVGNYPKRWDKTGVVIEVRHYQGEHVDGSGRITIRNHRFLRKYTPMCQPDRRKSILDDLKYLPTSPPVDQPSHYTH